MNEIDMRAADTVQSVVMVPKHAHRYLNEHSNKLNCLQMTLGLMDELGVAN